MEVATQFFKGYLLLASRKADIVSPWWFYYILSCTHNIHVSASSLGNLIRISLCRFFLFLRKSGIFITIHLQHTKQGLFLEVEVQLPGHTMTITTTKHIIDRQKWQISHLAKVLVFGMSFNLLIIVEKMWNLSGLAFPESQCCCVYLYFLYICIHTTYNTYCSHNFIIKKRKTENGKVQNSPYLL